MTARFGTGSRASAGQAASGIAIRAGMPSVSKKKPLVIVTRKLPERDRDADDGAVRHPAQCRRQADDRGRAGRGGQDGRRAGARRSPTASTPRAAPGRAAAQADRLVRHRRRPHRSGHRAPARHHRHQHAGRADRGHRRHDDGADARHGAAHGRGRAPGARRQMDRLEPDLDAGRPAARQAHGHRRHGPHRPGAGAPRAGLRPVDPLSQPQARPCRHRERARGDLLGEPRPDAGAHGHRLGQLPAHAGDVPSAVGAAAEADEAHAPSSSTPRAAR